MPTGYIYVVEAYGTGLHKVGFTTNIEKRLQSLREASPQTITLIALFDSDSDTEAQIAFAFRFCHSHHEWFKLPSNWRELLPEGMNEVRADEVIYRPQNPDALAKILELGKSYHEHDKLELKEITFLAEAAADQLACINGDAGVIRLQVRQFALLLAGALDGYPPLKAKAEGA